MKRVVEFIDGNLEGGISLADLARAAGLSPMHFARQFRRATNMRPREYLLRRRITRSQELLQTTDETLVDIALSVGFQSQAHFTTVFKRFTNTTPHQWRQENCAGIAHSRASRRQFCRTIRTASVLAIGDVATVLHAGVAAHKATSAIDARAVVCFPAL
jgi:AraC-like DNA-binding protein